jgi:general secretion pathway protein L
MLLSASAAPLVNLREGVFAKRERAAWITPVQKFWVRRLLTALVVVTMLLALATLAKYWIATASENDTALAAAQKIDPAIQDIDQAESMLTAALNRQGKTQGSFASLSAALWRSVKASPNVSVRELRYTPDGILTVVLAAPTADNINKALVTIQQDGFRITATPRQDTTGATLVDMTVRMP